MFSLCRRPALAIASATVIAVAVAGCKSGGLVSTSDEVEIGRQSGGSGS